MGKERCLNYRPADRHGLDFLLRFPPLSNDRKGKITRRNSTWTRLARLRHVDSPRAWVRFAFGSRSAFSAAMTARLRTRLLAAEVILCAMNTSGIPPKRTVPMRAAPRCQSLTFNAYLLHNQVQFPNA